jgi:hypothetical protein
MRTTCHQQEIRASAPWLADENVRRLGSGQGFYAIGIPAQKPEEAAADPAAEEQQQRLMRRGQLRRTAIAPRPNRHGGLAVLGVLVCEECTELLFHYVGPPHGEMHDASADLKANSLFIQALPLPTLTDDAGTS